MQDDNLLTLKQLAAELGLPESTVRYYRDSFLDRIPSVGTGRRRRYPPHAVAVLRSIAKSYAAGRSRAEIAQTVDQESPRGSVVFTPSATSQRAIEEVSNLDLLAAILDGEREQRDALWQMAKEIVRLSEVLEGQDKIIGEVADRAGVSVPGRILQAPPLPPPTLPLGPAPPTPAAVSAIPTPANRAGPESPAEPPESLAPAMENDPPPPPSPPPLPPPVVALAPPTAPVVEEVPPAPAAANSDMDRLRAELESERALVERLREAKLTIERRAADAEAELEHSRGRRSSVIKRLLGEDR